RYNGIFVASIKPAWLLIANKYSKMVTGLQHIVSLNPKAF
ncbi:4502_t:CDS:1, partial [Funneliformis geosporum]